MKIISMVPSWTETLLWADLNVVGRTRFCIHPKDEVAQIPAVGGTKDINWEKALALGADLILLDQEENPKEMAEKSPLPYFATHIKSVNDVERDCALMAKKFQNEKLKGLAQRWKTISQYTPQKRPLHELPGIIKWIKPPTPQIDQLVYLIWKKPWMAVSRQTFIGSVFDKLGCGSFMAEYAESYPEIDLDNIDSKKTLLLFSTEPFPFGKKLPEIEALPYYSALIDGEAYSWFGVRSLEFLEKNIR